MSEQLMVLRCVACGEPVDVTLQVESHGTPGGFLAPPEGPLWYLLRGSCEACGHVHTDEEITDLHGAAIAQHLAEPDDD